METCKSCGKPILSEEELKELLTKPYLIAIADKEFLKHLEVKDNAKI